MSYGVRLRVWGPQACFRRPEIKVERVSYDAMTPSAARGILEAVHWKPSIRWIVDRIHVLRPIRFQSLLTRSPALAVEDRSPQRTGTFLVDVDYVIEAHFELTPKADLDDTPAKHLSMFNRRAVARQYFHPPCLGARDFAANVALIGEGAPLPPSSLPSDQRNRDLGWMPHDIAGPERAAKFFRARLIGGVLDVQQCLIEGTAA